ncbi:hypothetical protein B0H14DRAFT_2557979 [Mycena olivaceomarginata]|nr:hypothetical protein B0H14DRAFT_2557979 [Mycena olivaceomarginata]
MTLFSAVIGFSSTVKLCLMLLSIYPQGLLSLASSHLVPLLTLSPSFNLINSSHSSSAPNSLSQPMDLDPPSQSNNYVSVDVSWFPRPDRSACRTLCQDFESAADMSKAVLGIILDADHKQISTESLLHVVAALNISVSGNRNLRFKVHILTVTYGSKISLNSLRRELKSLNLEHDDADSIDQLHRKLKHHITTLRRGNNVQCSQEQEQAVRAQYVKQLQT